MRAIERRMLIGVMNAVLPLQQHPTFAGATAGEADVGRYLDDFARRAPRDVLLGLRLGAWLIWLSPAWVLGRPCWFGSLSLDDQGRLLQRLSESRVYLLRELPLLFKAIASLGLCGLPEVQRRIGLQVVDAMPPAWAGSEVTQRGDRG